MAHLSITIDNTFKINYNIYKLWLSGLRPEEAVRQLTQQQSYPVIPGPLSQDEIVLRLIKDQWWTFVYLEGVLQASRKITSQKTVIMHPDDQQQFVEMYYGFDDSFARELLGRKLSLRQRKDLDAVSDKTDLMPKSCQRQFDNFKRVFKSVEDLEGSLVCNIENIFCLSNYIAKKYAAIVFMANSRFDTRKKRLQYLTLDDFLYCADCMINEWTFGAKYSTADDMDVDLDREFIKDLRDLKHTLDRDVADPHKNVISTLLVGRVAQHVISDLDIHYKLLSKAIVGIACHLIHSDDLRDFFVDVVEKVIEPCKCSQWGSGDMEVFLQCYFGSFQKIKCFDHEKRMYLVLQRFMETFVKCVLRMFHY